MSTILSTLLMVPLAVGDTDAKGDFEAPQVLTADGETFKEVIYPTPVLHDIDDDGQHELVVGDLIGNLWISEATNSDLEWGKRIQLESEGKALRLNNW